MSRLRILSEVRVRLGQEGPSVVVVRDSQASRASLISSRELKVQVEAPSVTFLTSSKKCLEERKVEEDHKLRLRVKTLS